MPSEANELKVTSPDQWGKAATPEEEGFIVELPSGNVIKMKRTMNMLVLLRQGRIPNPLASIVQKMIDTQQVDFSKVATDVKSAEQLLDLLDDQWMSAVLEPAFDAPPRKREGEETEEYLGRLGNWKPEKGKISVFEVDPQDKMYVMSIAQGGVVDLAKFREEQESNLVAMEDVAAVVNPPKRTGGARPKSKAR